MLVHAGLGPGYHVEPLLALRRGVVKKSRFEMNLMNMVTIAELVVGYA